MSKRRLLLRLWLPALSVLLIPIFLLNVNIYQLSKKIEMTTAEQYRDETERSAEQIASTIEESIFYGDRLISNPDMQALKTVNSHRTTSDYRKFTAASEALKNDLHTALDYSVSIYFNKSQVLSSTGSLYLNLESIYHNLFQLLDFSLNDFKEITAYQEYGLTFYPIGESNFGGIVSEGVVYSRPIAIYNNEENGGAMFVNLTQRFWQQNLPHFHDDDSFVGVIDDNGEILYASNELPEGINLTNLSLVQGSGILDAEALGADYLGSYSRIRYGITVLSIRSRSAVLTSVTPLLRVTWVLNIGAVCVMILTILMAIFYWSKKLYRTADLLPGFDSANSKDILSFINDAVHKLKRAADQMGDDQIRQQAMMREIFWDRALNNTHSDSLTDLASRSAITSDGDRHYVVLLAKVISASGEFSYEHLDLIRTYREHLIASFTNPQRCRAVGAEQLILLLPVNNPELYQYEAESVLQHFPVHDLLTQSFACSQPFTDMSDFYEHYIDCRNSVNSTEPVDRQITWSSSVNKQVNDFIFFPYELEVQLISGIRSGDIETVRNAYRQIAKQNFFVKSISHEMYDLLTSKFKLIVLSVYMDWMPRPLDSYLQTINEAQTESSTYSDVYRILQELCRLYQSAQAEKRSHLPRMLEEYFDDNYQDKNLNISASATYFGYSESYFSRMFKDVMGQTYSTYLETRRLQYADALLDESQLSIEQIADQVGYSSSNSFRRAYRRHYNISPSQRRSQPSS